MSNNLFVPKQILRALGIRSVDKVANILDDTSDSDAHSPKLGRQTSRRWGSKTAICLKGAIKKVQSSRPAFPDFSEDSASEMTHDISFSESSSSERESEAAQEPVRQRRHAIAPPDEDSSSPSSDQERRLESPNISALVSRGLRNAGLEIDDSPAPRGLHNSTQLESSPKRLKQSSITNYGELSPSNRQLFGNELPLENAHGVTLGCEGEYWFKPFNEYAIVQPELNDNILDSSPEDLEVYVIQCPRDLNASSLKGLRMKDIVGGSSGKKLSLPDSNVRYEAFVTEGDDENVRILHPSAAKSKDRRASFRLGSYKCKGSVVIVEDIGTEHQDPLEIVQTSQEKPESEELENGNKSRNQRKRKHSNSEFMSELNESCTDETVTPRKKKKRKKTRENSDDPFLPSNLESEEEPSIVKKKKKKKHKEHRDVDLEGIEPEPAPSEEPVAQDEFMTTKKKKKKRDRVCV